MGMIVGVDYASVDQNSTPNYDTFRRACIAAGSTAGFAIMRGAYGTWPDPVVQRDWRAATAAKLTCGAYLFLRLPIQGYSGTPEEQVSVFAKSVGTLTNADLVPIIDVEDAGLAAKDELEIVHRAWSAMKSTYGVPPMIYTSNRVWVEDLDDLPAGDMVDSPLWLAKPWPWATRVAAQLSPAPFSDPGNPRDPVVPAPWGARNWWIHQYQGDALPVPGFAHTTDLSRFSTMTVGETGARVAWLQQRIGAPVSATFDAGTAARVRAFQSNHGLVADAIVGPKTFAAVAWSRVAVKPPTASPASPGSGSGSP